MTVRIPSFAHSSRRRRACAAGRKRPVSPISPKAAVAGCSGALRPLGIDAGGDASRHREVGGGHERLHLEEQRPGALERAGDRRAGLAVDRSPEDL